MSKVKLTLAFASLVLSAATWSPAQGAEVLRFEENGCNFHGSVCAIAQTFGDTATVNVAYRSISRATGATYEDYLRFWNGGYGDLKGVAYGGANATGFVSEIKLTAAQGYKVSLLDFDYATFNKVSASTPFEILDLTGNILMSFSGLTNWPTHGNAQINTDYLEGVILRWGPDSYNVGVNNLRFDARSITTPGAVPEPATWLMMILGFAGAGAMLRRRHRPVAAALTA